jgi:hypothetical protein
MGNVQYLEGLSIAVDITFEHLMLSDFFLSAAVFVPFWLPLSLDELDELGGEFEDEPGGLGDERGELADARRWLEDPRDGLGDGRGCWGEGAGLWSWEGLEARDFCAGDGVAGGSFPPVSLVD